MTTLQFIDTRIKKEETQFEVPDSRGWEIYSLVAAHSSVYLFWVIVVSASP